MPAKKKAITKKTTKKKIVKTKAVKKAAVKKTTTKKKTVTKKVAKVAKKTAKKVVKKTVKKIVKKIVTPKAPKIKKIVAPQEFKAGENIVYPTHGVGRILTIEKFQYDLVEEQLYVIQFFQDKLTIRAPSGGPPGRDLDVRFQGEKLENLKKASDELIQIARTIPGVTSLSDNLEFGVQERILSLNNKGQSLGLSISEVGEQVRSAINGVIISEFPKGDEEVVVRLKLIKNEKNQLFN